MYKKLKRPTKDILSALLAAHGGCIRSVAIVLKVTPSTASRWLRHYGLVPDRSGRRGRPKGMRIHGGVRPSDAVMRVLHAMKRYGSARKAAHHLGLSPQYIYNVVTRAKKCGHQPSVSVRSYRKATDKHKEDPQ